MLLSVLEVALSATQGTTAIAEQMSRVAIWIGWQSRISRYCFRAHPLLHYRTPSLARSIVTPTEHAYLENKPQGKLDLAVVESRTSDLTE